MDGCKRGWVVLSQSPDGRPSVSVVREFGGLLENGYRLLVVDIPIGLLDRGTRLADRAAREILKARSCCVFTAPIRPMLGCQNYLEAKACRQKIDGKSLTRQAWAIIPKIIQVDLLLNPGTQTRIREGHPEVSFAQMNHGQALPKSKHTAEGQQARISLLTKHFPDVVPLVRQHSSIAEDVLDALAMLWTAHRISSGRALRLPAAPETDSRGLLMEMWA